MANTFYRKGVEKVLSGQINFLADTIVARMVRNDYAQDTVNDEFLSQATPITGATNQTLAGKSVANGVFDAEDIAFDSVPAGEVSEGLVLAKWTGAEATSPLIAYIDQISGFPLTTTGGDVLVQWDNGAYKIFSL